MNPPESHWMDPAGVSLYVEKLPGGTADDTRCVHACREMATSGMPTSTVIEIGKRFPIREMLLFRTEAGDHRSWQEQWFVVRSHTDSRAQNKNCLNRTHL